MCTKIIKSFKKENNLTGISAKKIYIRPADTGKDTQHQWSLQKCKQNCNKTPLYAYQHEYNQTKSNQPSNQQKI